MGRPTQAWQFTPETLVQIQPVLVNGHGVCAVSWSCDDSMLPSAWLSTGRSVCHRNSLFPVPSWGLVAEAGQEGGVALPHLLSAIIHIPSDVEGVLPSPPSPLGLCSDRDNQHPCAITVPH